MQPGELPQPQDDGLYMGKPVGPWSADKHKFLADYIYAFTTTMHAKNWSCLNYIDLFAGPGKLRIKDTNEIIWGSPLIAAHYPAFANLFVCEKNKQAFDALTTRLGRTNTPSHILPFNRDCNDIVGDIVDQIPPRSLSLAFLDPYGLHVDFKTVAALSNHRTDLIIFFPDRLDALRNHGLIYRDDPDSNLDRFLGDPGWRTALDSNPCDRWAAVLRDLYVTRLRTLGYSEFEYERIYASGTPMYLLIYCSEHPVGAKIWRGISQKKPDGQRTFGFAP